MVIPGLCARKRLRVITLVHRLKGEAGEGMRFAIAKHSGGDGFHVPNLAGLSVKLEYDGHGFSVLPDLGGDDLESPGHIGHKIISGKRHELTTWGFLIAGEIFTGIHGHGNGGRGEAGQDLYGWTLLRGDVEGQGESEDGEQQCRFHNRIGRKLGVCPLFEKENRENFG